ncbi:hypothetical protein [Paenibacillus sp. NRS-1760]|uniref:hypothetical protein n=1 Tax=Paenibacillus sp. NRS-1760 TaxID=3233902 RepID=UPI003D292B78
MPWAFSFLTTAYWANILTEQTSNHTVPYAHKLQCTLNIGGECLMGGFVGGANHNVGIILVLFILLVIIACSCGIFGGGCGY